MRTIKKSLAANFGRVIAEARAASGKSQEELAALAGVHRTYIGDIERGRKSPTLDVITALAQALGTKASALIARAEERNK